MELGLILLIISIIVSTTAVNLQLKCCPSGQLVKLENLSCINRDDLNSSSNRLVGSIATNDNENWPTCVDDVKPSFLIVENATDTSANSCVDLTERLQLVMVYCGSSETTLDHKSSLAYTVNRCCPLDTQYDYESRSCVAASNNSTSPLTHHDSSSVVSETFNLPKCATNEPLVEYYSKTHRIHFEKGLLSVNDRKVDGLFCIQDTTSGDLIVKVCEHADICTRIPCIRKCCNERMFFDTTPEDKAKCEDYEFDLMRVPFHNFTMGDDLLADQPPSMAISGKLKSWLKTESSVDLLQQSTHERNKKTYYQIHVAIN